MKIYLVQRLEDLHFQKMLVDGQQDYRLISYHRILQRKHLLKMPFYLNRIFNSKGD